MQFATTNCNKLIDKKNNLQLTINSTKPDTLPTTLLTWKVNLCVSVHITLSMIYVAVFTDVSVFNNFIPRYQDTLERGLLKIFRFSDTVELSFTISRGMSSIEGGSEWYIIYWFTEGSPKKINKDKKMLRSNVYHMKCKCQ